jgi:tetrahydromethanopterin S-methyltransferase subunit A
MGPKVRTISKTVEAAAGRLCERLFPIKQEYYLGWGKDIGICTLSSIDLLWNISRSDLMNEIAVCGRLLSENKGIDIIINFTSKNPDIKCIVACGKEVRGHRAGQALLALARNGVDLSGRIIGALGPDPILKSSPQSVDSFRRQVRVLDMIGTVSIDEIASVLVT